MGTKKKTRAERSAFLNPNQDTEGRKDVAKGMGVEGGKQGGEKPTNGGSSGHSRSGCGLPG